MRASVSFGSGLSFVRHVFPAVDRELQAWSARVAGAHPKIRAQALASMRLKRFHCLGGAVFSLWPGASSQAQDRLLRLIVAFQTISDYLDNLCDRMNVLDPEAFRRLHSSMLAALDMGVEPSGFYDGFPVKDDGGYLQCLVRRCRSEARGLTSFPLVRKEAVRLTQLYIDLQVHKHAAYTERVRRLETWCGDNAALAPELLWWEFAAASGSTLATFALFGLASDRRATRRDVDLLVDAYFPYICGLHILLDYFIDQEEDRQNHDLNLVSYYPESIRSGRMLDFVNGASIRVNQLPNAEFHRTVVMGLLAFYLSDPKVFGGLQEEAKSLLVRGGKVARLLAFICRRLRNNGML